MKAERMQILKMLEDGKITADEAAKLLETVEPERSGPARQPKRSLRVRVHDGERERIDISLPMSLARFGLNIASRFDDKLGAVDIDQIVREIEEGSEGRIVEVIDGDQRVEVFIE